MSTPAIQGTQATLPLHLELGLNTASDCIRHQVYQLSVVIQKMEDSIASVKSRWMEEQRELLSTKQTLTKLSCLPAILQTMCGLPFVTQLYPVTAATGSVTSTLFKAFVTENPGYANLFRERCASQRYTEADHHQSNLSQLRNRIMQLTR